MKFQEYEKDGRTIRATETAYKAIYEAQGFVPASAAKKPGAKGAKSDGKDGGNTGDNGKGADAGGAKGAK